MSSINSLGSVKSASFSENAKEGPLIPFTIYKDPLDLEGVRIRQSLAGVVANRIFTPCHFIRSGSAFVFNTANMVMIEASNLDSGLISKMGYDSALVMDVSRGPLILVHTTKIRSIQEYVSIHDFIFGQISGSDHIAPKPCNPFLTIVHKCDLAVLYPGKVHNFTIDIAHLYSKEIEDEQFLEKKSGWAYSEGKLPESVSKSLLETYTREGIVDLAKRGTFDDYYEWVKVGAAIKGAGWDLDFFKQISWSDIPEQTFNSMWQSFHTPRAGIGTLIWHVKRYDETYYRRKFIEYLSNNPKPIVVKKSQSSAFSKDSEETENIVQTLETNNPISMRVPDHLWAPGHVEIKYIGSGQARKVQIVPLLTIDNIRVIIDFYGFKVRENLMTKRVETEPPFGSTEGKSDNNVLAMLTSLLTFNRIPVREALSGFILAVAHERMYHPVKEWFNSIDKNKECAGAIRRVFSTIKLGKIPPELAYTYFERWIISAVAAIFAPSFRNRGVLTFQGGESSGKTTFFRSLMPSSLKSTFGEGIAIDPRSKDSLELAITHWVCELGELDATFRKSDIAMLKAFLTKGLDEIRFAYERRSETYPRQTIFCATVNQARFLADQGQNTRFWVIPIVRFDQFQDVEIGDEQIELMWLEAYKLFQEGRQWWLERDEERRLIDINKRHLEVDEVISALETKYEWKYFDPMTSNRVLTPTEICRELELMENRFTLTKISEFFQQRNVPSVSLGSIEAFAVPSRRQETNEQSLRVAAIREMMEAKVLEEKRQKGEVPADDIPPF